MLRISRLKLRALVALDNNLRNVFTQKDLSKLLYTLGYSSPESFSFSPRRRTPLRSLTHQAIHPRTPLTYISKGEPCILVAPINEEHLWRLEGNSFGPKGLESEEYEDGDSGHIETREPSDRGSYMWYAAGCNFSVPASPCRF